MNVCTNWSLANGRIFCALGNSPIKIYNKLQYAHPRVVKLNYSSCIKAPTSGTTIKSKAIYQLQTFSPLQRLYKLVSYLTKSLTNYATTFDASRRLVILLIKPITPNPHVLDKLIHRLSTGIDHCLKQSVYWMVCDSYALLILSLQAYSQDPNIHNIIILGFDSYFIKEAQQLLYNKLALFNENAIILGEAAAWVHLKRPTPINSNTTLNSLHSITQHCNNLEQVTTTLQDNISLACHYAGWHSDQITHCWRIANTHDLAHLSWYQASLKLWSKTPKTTLFTPCLGNLGHATLPFALALAGHIPQQRLMINISDHNAQHLTCCIQGKPSCQLLN